MVLRGVDCESHCPMYPAVVSVGVVMHVSSPHIRAVLTSGAANNTAHIPWVDQRWRQLWNKFGRYFIYTHTLTVNYHNIHSSAKCSAYEKYDIWWSLAASPGWRLCGVRLAQSVDENPQRIRRGAVSSEQPGAGFLHQQLFNLSRKQGGQQTKPSPGHEGGTVGGYNCG